MSLLGSGKITRRSLGEFLKRHASDERALDIGAGGSSYDRFFPNRLTIDVDPARKPDMVADAHVLPFADNEFALILCTEVLEHLHDPVLAIAEMKRVLKPDGKLILTTRFMYPVHDAPGDYFRYTRYGLEYLFARWRDVQIEADVSTMGTIAVLMQRLVFQSNMRGGKVSKGVFALLSKLFLHLDWLLVRQYGDIKRSNTVPEIMAAGYYLTARK